MTIIEQDRNRSAASSLRTVAGIVLLAALAIAPLNYGSTRLLPFQTLIALTAAGGIAWFVSCFISGMWPIYPLATRVGVVLIAFVASVWLFILPVVELPAFTARHLSRLTARWPHSILPRDFGLLLAWTFAALIAWFALYDLARSPAWRSAIAWVMLISGGALALLGLLQNATRADGIFWDGSVRLPGAFFGTFFHHTSAGAYLNTVWPLGFALALAEIRRDPESSTGRMLIYGSLICAALILVAHSGHVSRLPQVIAIVVLVAFTLWAGLWRAFARIRGLRLAIGTVAAVLLIAVLSFGASRLREINQRWNLLEWAGLRGGGASVATAPIEEWPNLMRDDLFIPSDHRDYPLGDRGAAYATASAAIAERPWFGWGPGGWTAAAAAISTDPFLRTFFLMVQFTHNDYLQTCVEWGLIGAAGWALLVPGAVVHALKRVGSHPSHDFVGAAAATALFAVLVQSLIDFPLQIPAVFFNALALSALAWSVPVERIHPRSVPPFPLS